MKLYRLRELYELTKPSLPFVVKWCAPGHAEHGQLFKVVGFHPTKIGYFKIEAVEGLAPEEGAIACPEKGIGWEGPDVAEWRRQETVASSLDELLGNKVSTGEER